MQVRITDNFEMFERLTTYVHVVNTRDKHAIHRPVTNLLSLLE